LDWRTLGVKETLNWNGLEDAWTGGDVLGDVTGGDVLDWRTLGLEETWTG
jgi:hypothetical protein